MRNLTTIALLSILLMSACSNASETNNEKKIVLSGLVELPAVEGVVVSTQCYGDAYFEDTVDIGCALIPISETQRLGNINLELKEVGRKYGYFLGTEGFHLVHRSGLVMFWEKPINSDCSNRIINIFGFQAEPEVSLNAVKTGNLDELENNMILFMRTKSPVCGDDRKLK